MTDSKATMSQARRLADALTTGASSQLADLFGVEGAAAPRIRWSPSLSDLSNPLILAYARTCLELTAPDSPIRARDFDLESFRAHLAWMMVLEVESDGTVFRYSHYGEGIAQVRGISMLGRTSADFGGHIGLFFTAAYRALLRRGTWLLTEHAPPKDVFARKWERLMVPVAGEDGQILRVAAMNVPDNELRAGLEIIPDPVMVLVADQIVRYANTAARRFFDRGSYPAQDVTLFDYTGIDLPIARSPTDMVRTHAVHDRVCLAMRDNLLRDFLVTISGARIWDHDFYVLTLRVDDRCA